jgi:hypothetical protein
MKMTIPTNAVALALAVSSAVACAFGNFGAGIAIAFIAMLAAED